MKIDIKELSEFTGIELTEETSFDEFKETFNAKFVPSETHSKELKSVNARAAHAINKSFRDAGFEVDKEEIDKVSLFELPSIYAKKVTERVTELESNKSATEEEISKKYEGKLATYETKVKDYEGLLNDTKSQFDIYKTEIVTKERDRTINGHKSKAMSSLSWSDSANDIVKRGFEAVLNDKYKFDINEDGSAIVRDRDGNLVQSKVKAGTPATYEEVVTSDFDELMKDYKKVANSKKVGNFGASVTVEQPVNGKQPQRYTPRYIN